MNGNDNQKTKQSIFRNMGSFAYIKMEGVKGNGKTGGVDILEQKPGESAGYVSGSFADRQ